MSVGLSIGGIDRYARISEDGIYRYALGRRWSDGPLVRYIMLNPSTADATEDDPTIRRCIGFAQSWGYAGIQVLNLYAFRATNPADLWRTADPVGPQNDDYLRLAANPPDTGPLIAAWGVNARPGRVAEVLQILSAVQVQCLGVTKAGQPKHPLYLAASTKPLPFGDPGQRINQPRNIAPRACSWCSHPEHADACERTIQTGSGKSPTIADCPCSKREASK